LHRREERDVGLPLLITDDEHIPIYLQIVHQIRYLITSRQLIADTRLPSVRVLAETLGVNAGTVAQAFRVLQQEGVIDSQRGRGTFVVPLPDAASRLSGRQDKLIQAIDRLVDRAYALGFDATTTQHHVRVTLGQRIRTVPVMLVAPSREAADKYTKLVAQALPDSVLTNVMACTVDELEAGARWVREAYDRTHFTLTFMFSVPRVESALRALDVDSEVHGFTAQVTPAAIARLETLPANSPLALATEARNVNSALGTLAQHTSVDVRQVEVFTELTGAAAWRDLGDRTLIYTFGMRAQLDQHAIPDGQRIELAFTLSDESVSRLRHLFDDRVVATA
jgi:GntR family transcriptional regulator